MHFHPQTDAYGSFFYLITGLHGAHVAGGLLMLLYVLVRAFAGHFDAVRHSAVSNAILYWHFVDVVWLFVFTTLYLLPRLSDDDDGALLLQAADADAVTPADLWHHWGGDPGALISISRHRRSCTVSACAGCGTTLGADTSYHA